ncbi:MAG: c-type cytochrome [Pseudomonadota bacterium]
MNAFEINKFVGAILAALVFAMGLSVMSDIIFTEKELAEPAYIIAIPDDAIEVAEQEEEQIPFETLLASADPEAGAGAVRVCGACHSWEPNGPNGIGPALHNIVGREIAAYDGFGYSSALVDHGAGGKVWDWNELRGFLENPAGWVPGTIMGYGGIADPEELADVVAYLASISPDGPPLPTASDVEVAAAPAASVTDATEAAADAPADAPTGSEASTDQAPAMPEEAPAAAEAENAAAATDDAPAEADSAAAAEEAPAESDTAATAEESPAEVEVAALEQDAPADDAATAAAPVDPFTQLVASADPAVGASKAVICQACHNAAEGAPSKVGPNLYNVFGPTASKEFNYSAAMQSHAASVPEWNVATLNTYLEAPMEVVPGTTMAYGGVKDENERAEIIAWLYSISPDFGPLIPEGASDPSVAATE